MLALSGKHLFFFFNLMYMGGGGGSWSVSRQASINFFYQIFLDLPQYFSTYNGVKILKWGGGGLWSKYTQYKEKLLPGFFNTTIVGKIFKNS